MQVIKTTGLEGGGDQGQEQGLHRQGFHPKVIGLEPLVLKALGREPLAHGAGLGNGDRLSGGPSGSGAGEGASFRVGGLRHRLDLGGERLGGEGPGLPGGRARTPAG